MDGMRGEALDLAMDERMDRRRGRGAFDSAGSGKMGMVDECNRGSF
ncbi:hypothetical protein [Paenibacillus borealis]|nr:hypothetical protein [Paenibacillus borealis]